MALQNNAIMPIREFLSKTLYIPTYQREYSWEDVELEDFWADLVSTVEDNDMHFFGQIVIHNEEDKKLYIIDGQQRTITSVIFLRALQKIYIENSIIKDTDDAKAIVSDISSLIGRKTRKSNDLHLVLGNDDRDYFISNIQTGYPDSNRKEKKKSQERMRKAFLYFETKLKQRIESVLDEEMMLDVLEAIYDAFKDNFKVLYMEATRLNEAFIIFETLNARGKDLETADLLKNYIFSRVNDVKEAEKKWSEMVNNLDGIDPTKFIRHLWNSAYEFSREKELYKKIVKTINTPKKSRELLESLAVYALVYHDLSSPTDCSFFTNERLRESLISLKNMKASAFYPVVLALADQKNFSDADIADIVQTIEVYVFRNFAIAGKSANTSEVFFAKIAKEISDQILTTKEEIQMKIREKMINNEEFGSLFAIWKGSSSAADKFIVRYIFRKIHSHLSATSEVVLDNNKVHIEHIMPQEGSLWTSISKDVHDAYLWRLGNLALLDATLNKEQQNKPFDEKRKHFAKSEIKPNQDIAAQSSWGENEINTRQLLLAKYALDIWN